MSDNEIDLFELFQTIWDGKWLLCTLTLLVTLIGFVYTQVAQPRYTVSVHHTHNIYSINAQQLCGSNVSCMEKEVKKRFLSLSGKGWSSSLSLSTKTPSDISEYEAQIEQTNAALTNEIYIEAKAELALMQTELADVLLGTETVARNMLRARRLIRSIDSGQSAMAFDPVVLVKSSPKVSLILGFSVVLGGMIGVFSILVRNAIMSRKKPLAKA